MELFGITCKVTHWRKGGKHHEGGRTFQRDTAPLAEKKKGRDVRPSAVIV